MTAAISLSYALDLYQELRIINNALAMIDSGGTLIGIILVGKGTPAVQVPLANVAVPNMLRAALVSRQNTLNSQLTALGVTV